MILKILILIIKYVIWKENIKISQRKPHITKVFIYINKQFWESTPIKPTGNEQMVLNLEGLRSD